MSDLLSTVQSVLQDAGITSEMPLVVGVSGGPDSLALLHLLLRGHSAENLIVAHLNHQLRGSAAADAAFVRQTAAAWGVRCHDAVVDVANLASAESLTLEEAARNARYRFLADVAHAVGATHVAVGHHADDQAETVLLRLVRGSGLQGLRGMQPVAVWPIAAASGHRPNLRLLRPLLGVTRAAIDTYCQAHALTPVLDETNADVSYLRNRVRHELLPLLETYNPAIRDRLSALADVVSADFDLLLTLEAETWQEVVQEQSEDYVVFNGDKWRALPLGLRRRMLRKAVLAVYPTVGDIPLRPLELARNIAETGATGAQADLPGAVHLTVRYEQIVIGRNATTRPVDAPQLSVTEPVELPTPGRVQLANGWELVAAEVIAGANLTTDPWQEIVEIPMGVSLWVRSRRDGERMQPLGMAGRHRKVQDVMLDACIAVEQRVHWPLVTTSEHIVWIPGVRLDERAAMGRMAVDVRRIHLSCRRLP